LIKLITTNDGSHTIYVPELDEHYHSVHGAVQESEFIFIRNGLHFCKANPVNIFEAGFGTGLNALLTAMQSFSGTRLINYTAIEKNPLPENMISVLNYHNFAGPGSKEVFDSIHSIGWNTEKKICDNFTLRKIKGDLTILNMKGKYDLIYFDAFSPDKQPEMWTSHIFGMIADITTKSGILVTYCVKGEVKRNLKSCGFTVSLLPGPPGKRQILRAIKN
jgi:tRNA U34 5-methylaminomethyl-2-thiouridine-forming methyltransferase MnmC